MAAEEIPGAAETVEEENQDFALDPGDLVVVIRNGGGTEVYVGDDEIDESDEGGESEVGMRAMFLIDYIKFALGSQECLDLFAKIQLN